METINITITSEQIETAVKSALTNALKDSYDSPVRKAVEASIKEKEGAIKQVVDSILTEAISSPEFKSRIADHVISLMVANAVKK